MTKYYQRVKKIKKYYSDIKVREIVLGPSNLTKQTFFLINLKIDSIK